MKRYPFLLIVLLTGGVQAQFQVHWSNVHSGGGRSATQTLSLEAAVGQPAAGLSLSGDTVLNAGYYGGTRGCGVNLTDLVTLCLAWMTDNPALNLSGEPQINFDDFAVLAQYWLEDCPSAWPLK